MTVGAELVTLSNLYDTFNNNAQQAQTVKSAVATALENSVWTGNFSDQFREDWMTYQKNLNTLSDALTDAARNVAINHNNIAAATGEEDHLNESPSYSPEPDYAA
ncbi:hypothetical protein [Brevibacterium litoralis]|uniref:hypothetical protein n=1 Tax=Brevibacterium litoralis TaxID=3138935 RepID=UPI0032EADE6C